MNSLIFGIVIGIFLYFAGSRFFVWTVRVYRERKADAIKNAEENVQIMIDKAVDKIKNKD